MPRNDEQASGCCGGSGSGSGNGSGRDTNKGLSLKPLKGWLHADRAIMNEGVTFDVRYLGCLEIKSSMKMLEFATRSLVAKECINRICEAAALKTTKKRRVDKKVLQCIADKPHMENAGTNVTLTVSSKCLALMNVETGDIIAKHDMPRISFASGGDTDTLDFVAYVAKDLEDWRACYVLECGGGQAQDLISTFGQAFELRYNEFFNKPLIDKDYYNDLPGKVPPDLLCEQSVSAQLAQLAIRAPTNRERTSSNLIDLNSPPPPVDHEYVNENKPENGNEHFSLSAEVQRSQLLIESWFHGPISRPASEQLLIGDGDFLVRESQGTPGQYVLSGMQMATAKHLLLIDPAGTVRTKDRIFESISHLINYHWTNSLPIISAESSLVLRNPIMRTTDLRHLLK